MSARFVESRYLPLGDDTFMWVLIVRFVCEAASDDNEILKWIIESPQYGYDFASPFDGASSPSHGDIHGRWWRNAISADQFRSCKSADAAEVIRVWANDQDWSEPGFSLSQEAQTRLDEVYEALWRGRAHQLENPSPDHEHEYGFVMGAAGFHEFVVVDSDRTGATLIVACDD